MRILKPRENPMRLPPNQDQDNGSTKPSIIPLAKVILERPQNARPLTQEQWAEREAAEETRRKAQLVTRLVGQLGPRYAPGVATLDGFYCRTDAQRALIV